MKTITVKLPPGLDSKLERLAGKLKKTKSVVVRLAIEELLRSPDLDGKLSAFDMLKGFSGILEGLPKDLSCVESYLDGYGE